MRSTGWTGSTTEAGPSSAGRAGRLMITVHHDERDTMVAGAGFDDHHVALIMRPIRCPSRTRCAHAVDLTAPAGPLPVRGVLAGNT